MTTYIPQKSPNTNLPEELQGIITDLINPQGVAIGIIIGAIALSMMYLREIFNGTRPLVIFLIRQRHLYNFTCPELTNLSLLNTGFIGAFFFEGELSYRDFFNFPEDWVFLLLAITARNNEILSQIIICNGIVPDPEGWSRDTRVEHTQNSIRQLRKYESLYLLHDPNYVRFPHYAFELDIV